ncbi:MAG: DoxX family membrane protein [Chloroflexi bacterium]|nr:DoxX family membrane protein [Chloroflexota bacterium]
MRTVLRTLLGSFLLTTGVGHLTIARKDFQAQVPRWLPLPPDTVVLASGVVELALGAALILLASYRKLVGAVVAAFFVAVFPGNVSQYRHRRNAFGLDTDTKRLLRLAAQPLLVLWAIWSTWTTPRR